MNKEKRGGKKRKWGCVKIGACSNNFLKYVYFIFYFATMSLRNWTKLDWLPASVWQPKEDIDNTLGKPI